MNTVTILYFVKLKIKYFKIKYLKKIDKIIKDEEIKTDKQFCQKIIDNKEFFIKEEQLIESTAEISNLIVFLIFLNNY